MEKAIIADHISAYNSARVFVYPGTSYDHVAEVPLTILEASACGLPVVTTSLYRHIDLPNITITDVDPESLAQALLRAGNNWNQSKRDDTTAAIREKYSLTSLGSLAESFFAKVIDGR